MQSLVAEKERQLGLRGQFNVPKLWRRATLIIKQQLVRIAEASSPEGIRTGDLMGVSLCHCATLRIRPLHGLLLQGRVRKAISTRT